MTFPRVNVFVFFTRSRSRAMYRLLQASWHAKARDLLELAFEHRTPRSFSYLIVPKSSVKRFARPSAQASEREPCEAISRTWKWFFKARRSRGGNSRSGRNRRDVSSAPPSAASYSAGTGSHRPTESIRHRRRRDPLGRDLRSPAALFYFSHRFVQRHEQLCFRAPSRRRRRSSRACRFENRSKPSEWYGSESRR